MRQAAANACSAKSFRKRSSQAIETSITNGARPRAMPAIMRSTVWLAGVSLSDAEGLPRPTSDNVRLALAGLGVACKALYETMYEMTFLRARGAAGLLGIRVPGVERDAKNFGYLRRHRDEAEAAGIEAMSIDAALQAIEEAVLRAFDLSDVAMDLADEGVPYRDDISFKSLRDAPWRRG